METPNTPARPVYSVADLRDWAAATSGLEQPIRLAIFGDPVAHSASPPMQNAALAARGVPVRYARLRVLAAELAEALQLIASQGFIGVNLTLPHKTTVLPLLHSIDAHAAALGAVNTVRVEADGTLRGFNTDGPGFVNAVRAEFGLELPGARVLILGAAGGAGSRGVAAGAAPRRPRRRRWHRNWACWLAAAASSPARWSKRCRGNPWRSPRRPAAPISW